MPVTLPEASTVANEVAVLLQVPPVAPSANGVEEPAHTAVAPDIDPASGIAFTATA